MDTWVSFIQSYIVLEMKISVEIVVIPMGIYTSMEETTNCIYHHFLSILTMGGINDSATSQKKANDSLTILDRFKNEFSNLLTPHIKHRHQVGPLDMSTSTGRSTRKSDTNVTRL